MLTNMYMLGAADAFRTRGQTPGTQNYTTHIGPLAIAFLLTRRLLLLLYLPTSVHTATHIDIDIYTLVFPIDLVLRFGPSGQIITVSLHTHPPQHTSSFEL